MSSFNKVILIGRLTRDPELRYTNAGKPVANFSLAVDRPKGQGQEKETDFFDCVLWGQTAEFASKYASKGRMVCVEGRLQSRSWDDANTGQKRKTIEVVCNDMRLLDKRESAGEGAPQQAPPQQYAQQQYAQAPPQQQYAQQQQYAAPPQQQGGWGAPPPQQSWGAAAVVEEDIPF